LKNSKTGRHGRPVQGEGGVQAELGSHPHHLQRRRHVNGKVKAVVKGGLVVNIGVEAFLPASQIDIIPPKNLNHLVGNTYDFKVVKINQERQNIVLSRRELIEAERNERRQKLLSEMVPGDIRKGTVKNITDFGAFIDLNGLDGLLHITDMSWGRIGHPSEMLKVGQELDVVVLDINKEKERVSLGLKQKLANPWDNIEAKYPVGQKVKGKVVNLVPYGAFVELEPGVEGLVHVTELSWTKRIAKPSDVLKQDQEVEAVVLGINRDEQKISASASASSNQSVGQGHGEVSGRHPRQGQDPQPHQLRRVHRAGGRSGRHDPRLRHLLDPQDQSPERSAQEGRRSRGQVLEVDKANQRIASA
jgi:ribosomal protein S1